MSNLLLKNLEIRAFRGFRHLKIERLGRVNLIVGKNNVGKTALLEALRLYATKGSPAVIWELLRARDEDNRSVSLTVEESFSALRYLFYGRQDVRIHIEPIQIGPIDSLDDKLSISLGYSGPNDERGQLRLPWPQPEEYGVEENLSYNFFIQIGGKQGYVYPVDSRLYRKLGRPGVKEITCISVSANGLSKMEIVDLWDNITLTSPEKNVLTALRIIAPGVEGINFVTHVSAPGERIPIVKIADIEEPLPLRNLGDGMQRMLGIALALVNAKNGILLVDEIENGLHYSVEPFLWKIIFQLARQFNVQVFATSHSWDCIEAFQQAAGEDKQTEGLLIRLEYKKGEVVPTLFDERELSIVAREQIEVR